MKDLLKFSTSSLASLSFEDYQRQRDLESYGRDTFVKDGFSEEALSWVIFKNINDMLFGKFGLITHFRVGFGNSYPLYNLWGLLVPESAPSMITLGYSRKLIFYNNYQEAAAAAVLRSISPITNPKTQAVSLSQVRDVTNVYRNPTHD